MTYLSPRPGQLALEVARLHMYGIVHIQKMLLSYGAHPIGYCNKHSLRYNWHDAGVLLQIPLRDNCGVPIRE